MLFRSAYELAEQIEKATGKEVRITVPGHTQRGGSPVPYDRVFSSRVGAKAADMILNGQYGYMVGMKRGETVMVPLEDVAGKLKFVDPDCSLIKEARMVGVSFGDREDSADSEEAAVPETAAEPEAGTKKAKKEKKAKKDKKEKGRKAKKEK